jgi:hypothetical protein
MSVVDSVQAKLDEYAYIIKAQMEELDRLRTENERLKAGLDAHQTLRLIYTNPNSPEGNRIKAAAAALPVEKPKLMSVVPSGEQDRRERWRAYQRYELKRQIVIETQQLPAPGWDAKLVDDTYQAPEGDAEPPMDLYGRDAIKAHVALSDILDAAERRKRNGNGSEGQD